MNYSSLNADGTKTNDAIMDLLIDSIEIVEMIARKNVS
jgi:methyltransferase-like protein